MVDFSTFVSVYAEKCGGDAAEAAEVWNAEKQTIESMSRAEVRRSLSCR